MRLPPVVMNAPRGRVGTSRLRPTVISRLAPELGRDGVFAGVLVAVAWSEDSSLTVTLTVEPFAVLTA